jgi:hypothetical protein
MPQTQHDIDRAQHDGFCVRGILETGDTDTRRPCAWCRDRDAAAAAHANAGMPAFPADHPYVVAVTVTNPQNDPTPAPGVRQGPAPTTIKMREAGSLRIYTASFTREQWMAVVQRDGQPTEQGWIDALPADAAAALEAERNA